MTESTSLFKMHEKKRRKLMKAGSIMTGIISIKPIKVNLDGFKEI